MKSVLLYVRSDCALCTQARALIDRLAREAPIEVREVELTEDHPRYAEYLLSIPVAIIDGKREIRSTITEEALREALGMVFKPTATFYAAKFLEALGFLTVFVGLVYGLLGDMWTDLYFFLAGIAVFAVGRVMEKREVARQRASWAREVATPPRSGNRQDDDKLLR